MQDDALLSDKTKPTNARSAAQDDAPDLAAPVNSQAPTYAALSFDADEFIQYVKDHDLSEGEAYEFLATVWVYVVTWVDLGFGIHPPQQTLKKDGAEPEPALDHESALVLTYRETFNNRSKEKTAPRPKRRAGRKDS
ncbi:hypothetical protein [Stappia indica]|uniref:hypothetical protein n=1 Tax=Stappia indica TaxID=538381 RepID=UPI00083191DE|nr:hypothetical protein [Stappia indica]